MSVLSAFTPVPAASIGLFEGLLGALPVERRVELFSGTLAMPALRDTDLGFEFGILEEAVARPTAANLEHAFALYQRPGRLFFQAARQAGEFAELLGLDVPFSPEDAVNRNEDVAAQWAWHRFRHLEAGAVSFLDMGSFFDPVGALSGGIIYYLDQQGMKSHWDARAKAGEEWIPPPIFGVLSRESPERLARYNEGQNDRVGNVDFGFPPELRMVVAPNVYADLLREGLGFHATIPASEILDEAATSEWAQTLRPDARILTSIKGLVDGHTPLEYLADVLEKAGRRNPVIDFLGYASSSKLTREQRELRAGRRQKLDLLEIVLATPDANHGVEIATRFAGAEARLAHESYQGLPLLAVENRDLPRPVRFVVLSDRDAIRANEKASIDKNLQAIRLGGDLFKMMEKQAVQGVTGEAALYERFREDYQREMRLAEEDIRKVLELERIPENKRILLPGVVKDLYGSWGTEEFEAMYQLVHRIFRPDAPREDWQEAMVLLKLRIRQYYSVRNPCYGFCMAADRAAMTHGRWLGHEELKATAQRLLAEGKISQRGVSLLGLSEGVTPAHFFFSMIPEGLVPEGLQVAAQLPDRCGNFKIKFANLPETYRKAFFLVQRLERSVFLDAKVARDIVQVSRELAHVFEGDPRAEKAAYIQYLSTLRGHFETGYRLLRAAKHILRGSRGTQVLLGRVIGHLRLLIRRLEEDERLGPREIAVINQGVIEALTAANLFRFLPPEESRMEASHLLKKLKSLVAYVQQPEIGTIFRTAVSSNGTENPYARLVVDSRDAIFEAIGQRLIDQTYQMNIKLHSEDRAITRGEVAKALDRMTKAIEEAAKGPSSSSSEQTVHFFLGGVAHMIRQTRSLLPKKLNTLQCHLIYQALVETLIHTRRFLVLPPDRAEVEVGFTLKRFFKIQAYLKGDPDVESPLWFFGNGYSNPPPATD